MMKVPCASEKLTRIIARVAELLPLVQGIYFRVRLESTLD
jgi:hypothetical protein